MKDVVKEIINDPDFLKEELFRTQQALFNAKSVREIKFLQKKIDYLKARIKEMKQ